MEYLRICGGRPLNGTAEIGGAKNAALPILAATALCGGKYVLSNCPDISDVAVAAEILERLGGRVHRIGRTLTVDTRDLSGWTVPASLMEKMRASILFLGALLSRFGKAVLTLPGGCPLGRRPIDLHLQALSQMGAAVTLQEGQILCTAPYLHGCVIDLPLPSVGATENILLAAVGCRGTVQLTNYAREPEVMDLIGFLRAMGADIRADGESLKITGGAGLQDTDYVILPDRIETATYLCAAAACGGTVTLEGTDPSLLSPVVETLTGAGCRITAGEGTITLQSDGCLHGPVAVETAPYPGFPTDAQAVLMAAMIGCEGTVKITERLFERRFSHAAQLRRFGASVRVEGNTALLQGTKTLSSACVWGGDLRAAAALAVGALQIPGESRIFGVKHLRRGYDTLDGKLRQLGADVTLCQ